MKYLVFVWAYNVILYKVEYMIVTDWVPEISSFFKASSKYVHKSHASSHDGVARVDNFICPQNCNCAQNGISSLD